MIDDVKKIKTMKELENIVLSESDIIYIEELGSYVRATKGECLTCCLLNKCAFVEGYFECSGRYHFEELSEIEVLVLLEKGVD